MTSSRGYDTNDTLIGHAGDDILRGGAGDNTYVWKLGDGHDRISDARGANVLLLGNDVYCSAVKVKRDGDDLHFIIGGEGITVENWFGNPANSTVQAISTPHRPPFRKKRNRMSTPVSMRG